jgi:hypothetical protein
VKGKGSKNKDTLAGIPSPLTPILWLTSADGNGIDLQMGLPDSDVDAAADGAAEAGGETQVIGAHGDFVHDLGGFADQGGPFEGLGDSCRSRSGRLRKRRS